MAVISLMGMVDQELQILVEVVVEWLLIMLSLHDWVEMVDQGL
jgi:hypothetical protein